MQWPRATPRVAGAVDAAVAAGFSALALVETVLRWDDGYSAGPDALNIPLLLLVTLPLALRRRALTRASIVGITARYPLATVRVVTLIYAHALGLKLAGVPIHPHPQAGRA